MPRVIPYILCLVCSLLVYDVSSQDLDKQLLYHQVNIFTPEDATIHKLQELGFDLHCGTSHGEHHVELVLSDLEIKLLENAGLAHEVVIADLSKATVKRLAKDYPKALKELEEEKLRYYQRNIGQEMGCGIDERNVPLNFQLGSMNGFTRYTEMLDELDRMVNKFPDLISIKKPLSDTKRTFEGRPIYYVKISDNPNVDEGEPEVLYTGMHHAREPLSMMSQLYFMWYLLENYSRNDEIKKLVDHTSFYFVPVLNPDGVLYNESTNPNGGGYWRKNRNNGHGVDPNRNYGYNWGVNSSGSSGNPSSEIYRGTAPFSEPETQMIRDFIEARDIKVVQNIHTYSELLLTPFGTDEEIPEPDASLFYAMSEQMTWENRYQYGNTKDNIYPVNGDADDWAYGEQQTKNKIFSFTPEIGARSAGGFWPSPSDILPQCQEVFRTYLMAAYVSGNYAVLHDQTSVNVVSKQAELTFLLEHISATKGSFTLTVDPLTENIVSVENRDINAGVLADNEHKTISTNFNLHDDIIDGEKIQFEITLNNGAYDLYSKVITKYYKSEVVLEEQADEVGMNGWGGSWTASEEHYQAGYSFMMSEDPQSTTNYLTIDYPLDLTVSKRAVAEFYMKYDIIRKFGYVTFEASLDKENWTSLCGTLTKKAVDYNINRLKDQPVYDGRKKDWVREEVDLSSYLGQSQVYLRFKGFVPKQYQERSFFIDDLAVFVDEAAQDFSGSIDLLDIQFYPNLISSDEHVLVKLNNNTVRIELDVYQSDGRLVARHVLAEELYEYELDMSALNPGLYFVKLHVDEQTKLFKLIITH